MKPGFLVPGMQLMRRMRVPVKLGLLALVLFVPMVIVSVLLIQRLNDAIEFTRAEIDGASVVKSVSALIVEVQKHRGQTNMLLSGDATARNAVVATRERLRSAQNAVEKSLAARPDFGLQGDWAAIASSLNALEGTERLTAQASFAQHSEAVLTLRRFIYTLAERSNLLFDPEPASYFLMDVAVTHTPRWGELLGQARGLGAGLLALPDPPAQALDRVRALLGDVRSTTDDIVHQQRFTEKYGKSGAPGQEAAQAVEQFLQQARAALDSPGSLAPADYFAAGTKAIDAVSRYQDQVHEALNTHLHERMRVDQRQRQITIASAALGIALVTYLMLSFYFSFVADFRHAIDVMRATAKGNLRSGVEIRGRDELAEMAALLGQMNASLSGMVAAVRSNSALVAFSGMNLASGNRALADRTEQQAASLQQTAASVQQLSGTVKQNAATAGESDGQATRVRDIAEAGAHSMSDAVASVEGIQKSAQKMQEIIGVIDGLAFQTNILALNAAVEAARAGEQGRGFAVVAGEVRTLAQRSAASAQEIRRLIEASGEQVSGSVSRIRSAGATMQEIVDGVRSVAANMSLISTASAEQSGGLSEISSAVVQLDQITQRNAQMVERAVNQSTLLENRAESLSKAVSSFLLQQGTAEEAVEMVTRALAHREQFGRDSFLADITAPANGFFDRDMYVFALDGNGVYRAFGGKPEKVGTRLHDIPGVDGEALLRAIVDQAEEEPGWVEYDITNPNTGRVQNKMSYVVKVDGYYIGCGVYKAIAAG